MKQWHVTYYYLATGMEGNADTRDHGYVEAETAEEARKIVARREYREGRWEFDWLMGCLSAVEVKHVTPGQPKLFTQTPEPHRELLKKYMRLVVEHESVTYLEHVRPNEPAHYTDKTLVFTAVEVETLKEIEKEIRRDHT